MSSLVLALGDSLTAGYGLGPDQCFPVRLQALLRQRDPAARVVNAGVSGDTSAGLRARLPRRLAAMPRRPDLAILQVGANDFLFGHPVAALRANLAAMLDALEGAGIPTLLAGMVAPAFLGPRAAIYSQVYPEVAARRPIAFYPDFLAGVAMRPGMTQADGIHPNARAIEIVAAGILPLVEAALAGNCSLAA